MFFWCGDALNKISICGVVVISNLTVCDVCVFHAAVFGEMKLFAVLWFLVWLGDAVIVNFFFAVFRAPPCPLPVACSKWIGWAVYGPKWCLQLIGKHACKQGISWKYSICSPAPPHKRSWTYFSWKTNMTTMISKKTGKSIDTPLTGNKLIMSIIVSQSCLVSNAGSTATSIELWSQAIRMKMSQKKPSNGKETMESTLI